MIFQSAKEWTSTGQPFPYKSHYGKCRYSTYLEVSILLFKVKVKVKISYFRQFETAYNELVEAVLPVISNSTGCYPPCSYKEYRFTGTASEAGVSKFSSFFSIIFLGK